MVIRIGKARFSTLNAPVSRGGRWSFQHAFALMETVMAIMVVGILAAALISGMNLAVRTVQLAQEELQATQVMVDRLDTLRLCSWENLTTPGYISRTFQTAIYPGADGSTTVGTNGSPAFNGTVTIANSGLSEAYAGEMKLVTVSLNWQSLGQRRTRSMSTFVARYGVQNYVF